MKRAIELLVAAITVFALLGTAICALAQESTPGEPTVVSESAKKAPVHRSSAPGTLIIPKSSLPQTPPTGHQFAANTNVEILIPHGVTPEELPPFQGYGYETPASLACQYGFTTAVSGCNPNNSTLKNPTGGSQSIAIVDAYDDPSAPGDLAWFSLQFGIPLTASQFEVVWANTSLSSCNYSGVPTEIYGGWELEESLDIEWAHAMAPSAKIYLVEACSNYENDLQQAVMVANNLVQCGNSEINPSSLVLGTCPSVTGKGEVSMSWGGGEWSGETGTGCAVTNTTFNDSCFTAANVVYVAATGDGPGVIYPSASHNVVAAGGTSNRRSYLTFNFEQEAAWVYGGGGVSFFESQPTYQTGLATSCSSQTGESGYRCVPDLSFDADPYTGVYVYDTFPIDGVYYYEWLIVGGTSVSAPALAGVINRAGSFAASSTAELTTIYANRTNTADFTDVTAGFCGFYMGFTATSGYDPCTGVGTPKGYAGK
jgi:subtilase family serine protease